MPKENRLTRADFERMSKIKPKRLHGQLFSLSYIVEPNGGVPKMACVVAKKTASRAADRNRVRRSCREALRVRLSALPLGAFAVFYAKREAVAAPFSEIERDISKLIAALAR